MNNAGASAGGATGNTPEQLQPDTADRDSMTESIRRALASGHISAHFQRIVELPTMRTLKVEALARLFDADHGEIAPDVFIPIAECNGMIDEIDFEVLQQALSALSVWRNGGRPQLCVNVNISSVTLMQSGAAHQILKMVAKADVPKSSLFIKATDSKLSDEKALRTIEELADAGIRVSIDRYGTMFANLTDKAQRAVQEIKINRSYTKACHKPVVAAQIRSVVALGNALGINVVAEGVETGSEERLMANLGVRLVQGFLYGAPLPETRVFEGLADDPIASGDSIGAVDGPNEAARLDVLRSFHILDTDPEESFDSITRIASRVCDTPIALISLVDERRQWFKSNVGLDVPETSREQAFCAHTILDGEPMIVENALGDPRFATNPLVLDGPLIRFYGGIPLVTKEGVAIGALCVLDRRPRRLSDIQIDILKNLAEQVVSQLSLRVLSLKLAQSAETMFRPTRPI